MVIQSLHEHITLQKTYCLNYNTNLVKIEIHIVKQQHSMCTPNWPFEVIDATCATARGHEPPSKDR